MSMKSLQLLKTVLKGHGSNCPTNKYLRQQLLPFPLKAKPLQCSVSVTQSSGKNRMCFKSTCINATRKNVYKLHYHLESSKNIGPTWIKFPSLFLS